MITTCTICQARYQLDGTKVPRKVIRVRCPACSGVFVLDGTAPPMVTEFQVEEPAENLEPQEIQTPITEQVAGPPEEVNSPFENNDTLDIPEPEPAQSDDFSSDLVEKPIIESALETASVDTEPARTKRRRSKEEMLARALVSDILVYNRDLRDTAIQDGKLLEALGGEIKKSWELYKEKVTPDVANSTNHFREALNEILAEGEKVF